MSPESARSAHGSETVHTIDCVLITGGAGFIGSHLADELLAHGYRVRVLDNLSAQVHGPDCERPGYLDADIELIRGDVRDRAVVDRALHGVDAVFHLAAAVGVGQSMYQIAHYTDVNSRGTAVLLEALIDAPVERLIVASGMSIYGEGMCRDADGVCTFPPERDGGRLRDGRWELEHDGRGLTPVPTPESKPASPASVYALTKLEQERLCLMAGRAYGIPTTALRLFNVYGTRQALSNPHAGVMAIFASRLLNGRAPLVFEDGGQQRDFVHVYDVVRACRLALEKPGAAGRAINIGSGRGVRVRDVAQAMAEALGIEDDTRVPKITGMFRVGDVRHCFADITLATELLGYQPQVTLAEGVAELVGWMRSCDAHDGVDAAVAELAKRGLHR